MDHKTVNQYIMPLDQPVMSLNCVEAFNGLTDQEKLYTYHMSQASWLGGLIVTVQVRNQPKSEFMYVQGCKIIKGLTCKMTTLRLHRKRQQSFASFMTCSKVLGLRDSKSLRLVSATLLMMSGLHWWCTPLDFSQTWEITDVRSIN